ncbi:hypothetical protein MIMGU_mgv1a013034mg [Erythranthe guttata]|uniref:Band 7 domain-containing protein n=1 Tax=Erythranthe guttata TaxID=4155 RepID=A0A022PZN3_ERYGU|nr:hypothetical protein MIMGU_mgv1a013034mg [Erythranthe guttata]
MNVLIDANLYVKIVDPKLASYGVKNPLYAAVELAQTTMQNEIGQITFMQAIGTRVALNKKIEIAINEAGERWGLKCMRYTTKDIAIPDELSAAMQKKAVSKLIRSAYAYEFKAMQAEIDLGNARKEAAKNISEAMQQYKDYLAEDLETIYAKARAIANKACATAKELDVVLPFLEETGDVNVRFFISLLCFFFFFKFKTNLTRHPIKIINLFICFPIVLGVCSWQHLVWWGM